MLASAEGTLAGRPRPEFSDEAVVTVVLASENYPETPVTGRVLIGIDDANGIEGVHVTHAATAVQDGDLIATGGRVLSVVGRGADFAEARSRAYEGLAKIQLEGGQYRTDIGRQVMSGFTGGEKLNLEGWTHAYSGKVRDLYVPTGETLESTPRVLVVASDRVSAFDHVLEPGIPGKGELLTTLSMWWFDQLGVPNHLREGDIPAQVQGKAMLVANLDMFPVECVVRGYLSGSGWVEYQESQSVCGIALPAGLQDGDKLPQPIYTPAWKAPFGEHDENITFERTVELVGLEDATELRDLSLFIFNKATELAAAKGILLADTKFEFGRDRETGVITLADEVLTSDSSRYWDAAAYAAGTTPAEKMTSFDKQIVRNWLSANWDKTGTPPVLPADIVERTADRYRELISRMLG
jgi:phosphoribosylaminoimidazole-succinocarboxamide synthase